MVEKKQKIMGMEKVMERAEISAENGVAQTKHFQRVLIRALNGANVRFELE